MREEQYQRAYWSLKELIETEKSCGSCVHSRPSSSNYCGRKQATFRYCVDNDHAFYAEHTGISPPMQEFIKTEEMEI